MTQRKQNFKKDAVGGLHTPERKHERAFNLAEWLLLYDKIDLTNGWEFAITKISGTFLFFSLNMPYVS